MGSGQNRTEHYNVEVFNISDPCMSLLADAGFNATNAFWRDGFCRRERRDFIKNKPVPWVAEKKYNANAIQLHRDWLLKMQKSTTAKVEVPFGDAEKQHFFQQKEQ
jgi:hypothetical protein